jgi:hypothetical protein
MITGESGSICRETAVGGGGSINSVKPSDQIERDPGKILLKHLPSRVWNNTAMLTGLVSRHYHVSVAAPAIDDKHSHNI